MRLWQALGLPPDVRLGIIGGGGKTSALFMLGREAVDQGYNPALSTTTRMFFPSEQWNWLEPLVWTQKPRHGMVPFYFQRVIEGKVEGLQVDQLDLLPSPLLYEADGSKRLPVKIHGSHEPVLASTTTHTLVVFGMSAWGRTLSATTVHRPELLKDLEDLVLDAQLAARLIQRLLTKTKGVRCLLLNQCASPELWEAAVEIAKLFGGQMRVAAREHGRDPSLLERRVGPVGEPDFQKDQCENRR